MTPYIREVKIDFTVRPVKPGERPGEYLSLANTPHFAAEIFKPLADEGRECISVMLLDTRNRCLAVHNLGPGTINKQAIYFREIFRAAVLADAANIILAHNHPGGTMAPSPDDITATKQAVQAGDVLEIGVLDHIIVGKDLTTGEFKFHSMAQNGQL